MGGKYEEGICILSKELPLEQESRIVSKSTSKEDITTHKVIYGAYQKVWQAIQYFSAHLHWRQSLNDEEQNNQIKALKAMAIEKEASSADAITIVAGDFNGNPTSSYPYSEGYTTMVGNGDYIDAFLAKILMQMSFRQIQDITQSVGVCLEELIIFSSKIMIK